MRKLVPLFLLALFMSGCASILSKSKYPITITTDPTDAQVSVTDGDGMEIFKGKSPATVTLQAGAGFFKKATYTVTVNKAGYDEKVMPIQFKTDGWYWGNILIGGIIGLLIIDPATGAMYKPSSEFVAVTLSQSVASEATPELQIIDISKIPESWKSKLVKIED